MNPVQAACAHNEIKTSQSRGSDNLIKNWLQALKQLAELFFAKIPPTPPRPDFEASREKLAKLSEGEGSMTKEEFARMKQELEAWVSLRCTRHRYLIPVVPKSVRCDPNKGREVSETVRTEDIQAWSSFNLFYRTDWIIAPKELTLKTNLATYCRKSYMQLLFIACYNMLFDAQGRELQAFQAVKGICRIYTTLHLACWKCARMRFHCANGSAQLLTLKGTLVITQLGFGSQKRLGTGTWCASSSWGQNRFASLSYTRPRSLKLFFCEAQTLVQWFLTYFTYFTLL